MVADLVEVDDLAQVQVAVAEGRTDHLLVALFDQFDEDFQVGKAGDECVDVFGVVENVDQVARFVGGEVVPVVRAGSRQLVVVEGPLVRRAVGRVAQQGRGVG